MLALRWTIIAGMAIVLCTSPSGRVAADGESREPEKPRRAAPLKAAKDVKDMPTPADEAKAIREALKREKELREYYKKEIGDDPASRAEIEKIIDALKEQGELLPDRSKEELGIDAKSLSEMQKETAEAQAEVDRDLKEQEGRAAQEPESGEKARAETPAPSLPKGSDANVEPENELDLSNVAPAEKAPAATPPESSPKNTAQPKAKAQPEPCLARETPERPKPQKPSPPPRSELPKPELRYERPNRPERHERPEPPDRPDRSELPKPELRYERPDIGFDVDP